MDILLVNGIHFCKDNIMPQLGSICLYENLKEAYDVEILNFDYLFYKGEVKLSNSMEENINLIAEYILALDPRIVQFYTICISYPLMLLIAKKVKQLSKEVIIIMGGPQVTSTPIESLQQFDFIDVIGLGEGELYIKSLVDALLNKKSLEEIKGIAFKVEGRTYISYCDDFLESNKLGSYTKFNFDKYIEIFPNIGENLNEYTFQLEAGRGCPYNCTFCSSSIFWKRQFRVKPVKKLIEEIEFFTSKYKFEKYILNHDMFTANKRYVIDFCERLLESKMNIVWGCSSRLDVLDDKMIMIMKKANCNFIYLGFESGSQRIQQAINKNLNIKKAMETVKKIKKVGMEVTVSFIYGFPDENESDFFNTIDVIEQLFLMDCDNIQLHKYFPLPGTSEANKIEALYFNRDDIDVSIFCSCIYDNKLISIIKERGDIFSAFYSFDSIVREKYRRMDILIDCFNIMKKTFKKVVEYLINVYGLSDIYIKCSYEITQAYYDFDNRNINDYLLNLKENEIIENLFVQIFYKMTKDVYEITIKEIFRFEYMLYKYRRNIIVDDRICFFDVDVLEIESGNDNPINKICFIKFTKNKKETIVKKLKWSSDIQK